MFYAGVIQKRPFWVSKKVKRYSCLRRYIAVNTWSSGTSDITIGRWKMIFPAYINLLASSHYKGMYPHGSPILWYIQILFDLIAGIIIIFLNSYHIFYSYSRGKNPDTTFQRDTPPIFLSLAYPCLQVSLRRLRWTSLSIPRTLSVFFE